MFACVFLLVIMSFDLNKNKMNKKAMPVGRQGFTLIELLIVVTIIGILAVALVPKIVGGGASARDSRRMTDVTTIANGLEYYLIDNPDFDDIDGGKAQGEFSCAADLVDDLAGFVKSVPSDPKDDNANTIFDGNCLGDYVVFYMLDEADGDLNKYAVGAHLESPSVGDENVYTGIDSGEDVLSSFLWELNGLAYGDGDGDGYYIVY